MARRCRLNVRAFMDNAVREPGYEFTLLGDDRGPHKAVRDGHDRIDYDIANGIDANRILAKAADIPLYTVIEEIPDPEPQPQAEGERT